MWGETELWCPQAYVREQHPSVHVLEHDLPGSLLGCVDHERRIIWLKRGLTPAQWRCTLAFEIGHFEHGPMPPNPELAAARRAAATDWAARRLIPTNCLVFAFQRSTHLQAIADDLCVDLPTLRARLRGMTDHEQDAVMDAIRWMQTAV